MLSTLVFFSKGLKLITFLESLYSFFMLPVLNKWNLFSIVGVVFDCFDVCFIGNKMMDSKMKTSFQITSILCSDGMLGVADAVLGVLINVRIRRWYRWMIFVLVPLFVLSQIFCLKGGGG